jgi:cystathionine gamma-synthase/cystathionine gamma-lyase/cystathionine beta-lyase
LAEFLEASPQVARVHYPGLTSHAQHARARRLLAGFGGMVSFELHGGTPAVERFLRQLTLPIIAPSLGGTETLITQPARTSHAGLSADERRKAGISDGLIRVSLGLEDPDDLIADFDQALA